jgi:N-acetylmuramoyl-L-alanine amidase
MKFLISPGHGRHKPGKRSPHIPPGIYEWEFNRTIADWICQWGVLDCENISPGPMLPTLDQRVQYVNRRAEELDGDVALVCIHANAMPRRDRGPDGWQTKASGPRIHVAKRASVKSVDLAVNINHQMTAVGTWPTSIKRTNLSMLSRTTCPAVYVECGFMDHEGDARFMASTAGQFAISTQIYSGMVEFANLQ